MDASARSIVNPPDPPPHYSASEGIGRARGLGNESTMSPPESHPEPPARLEPRGFPVGAVGRPGGGQAGR